MNAIPLRTSAFGLSHVGRVRSRNEDCIHIDPAGRFLLLADGMGGHRGGKEASALAISVTRQFLEYRLATAPSTNISLRETLRDAFFEAATQVAKKGAEVPELDNMGTTLVMWARTDKTVYVGWAGDSRAYLMRDGQLALMSFDHCLTNEQIKFGMDRDVALNLPMGHVLTRNVGISPPSQPAIFSMPLEKNDLWLICSDGLSNKLEMGEMASILKQEAGSLPNACKELVEQAFARGGEDNISVILGAIL